LADQRIHAVAAAVAHRPEFLPIKQTHVHLLHVRFLYKENHSLNEWFKKAYGDE
jgi:hypothetical protein